LGGGAVVATAKSRLETARAKEAKREGRPAPAPKRVRPPALLEENLGAWDVFLALMTQVNVAGMGGVIGFRYESLPAVFRYCDIGPEDETEVFAKLRRLEAWFVAKLNRKKKPAGTGGRE